MGADAHEPTLERCDGYWLGRFSAMASPNEVLMDVDSRADAEALLRIAVDETRRIERKFSRYRDDNIVHRINHAGGERILVDAETADLLDFAERCHALSEGRFDITSGVLRRVWRFDGSDRIPEQQRIEATLRFVGWNRVRWARPYLTLQPGMEIDLGGLGKEYAVDRSAALMARFRAAGLLVNYGGDLYVTGTRRDGTPWTVGIDDPAATGRGSLGRIRLERGGLTTSGDARRFLLRDGVRYGHILDPMTGWPVAGAPRSVTVVADTCMEAGVLSTIAMLQGSRAEEFLQAQQVPYWLG